MSLKKFILKIFEVEPSGEEILNKIYELSSRLTLTHLYVGKFGQIYEKKTFYNYQSAAAFIGTLFNESDTQLALHVQRDS